MSDQPTVLQAIRAVMAEVQAIGKRDRNTEQNYSFRGIDAVINAVGPKFRDHGIVATPLLESASYRDVQTSKGKPSRECTVKVTYRFYGPAGDHLDVIVPGESMDFGDKGTAKAMSVAYRIALLQLLTIPTHESDPDEHSYERDNAPPAAPLSRDEVMERGRQAIRDASTGDALGVLARRASELLTNGQITADDEAELQRLIEARQDELEAAQ